MPIKRMNHFLFIIKQWLLLNLLTLLLSSPLMAKSLRIEYYRFLKTTPDSMTEIPIYKGKVKLSKKRALKKHHIVFIYNQKDQLIEIQCRNKKNLFDSYLEASIIRFQYNNSGDLIQETYYDGMNRPISKARNENVASIFIHYDKDNHLIKKTFYDKRMMRSEDWQGISRLVYHCDKQGRIIEKIYYDKENQIIENWLGIAMTGYQYDKRGNLLETSIYNKYKRLTEDKRGISISRSKRDKQNRLIEKSYYDKNNKLVDGIAYRCWQYYDDLAIIERTAYDRKRQLIDAREGLAVIRWRKTNKRWRIFETLLQKKKNHFVLTKYDRKARRILNLRVNKDGNIEDIIGKAAIIQWYYDSKGRIIQQTYFNSKYKRIEISGRSSQRWKYDSKNNIIEYLVYSRHNKLVQLIRYRYDRRGRIVKLRYVNSISKYNLYLENELKSIHQYNKHRFSLFKRINAYFLETMLVQHKDRDVDINAIQTIRFHGDFRTSDKQHEIYKKWLIKPE